MDGGQDHTIALETGERLIGKQRTIEQLDEA